MPAAECIQGDAEIVNSSSTDSRSGECENVDSNVDDQEKAEITEISVDPVQTSVIKSDNVTNRIPTIVETSDAQTEPNAGVQIYYQEVERLQQFSEADGGLLDKYGACIPNNVNATCETQNIAYQSYQSQPNYSYQPDAQVYSHYEQTAQYNQPHAALNDDEQISTQEDDPGVIRPDQRSYTSLSSASQHETKYSSVKTEPRTVSPGPSTSATNWPTYIPVPNVDMTDYNQYQQYGEYPRQDTRTFSGSAINVPGKSVCDPMLAGSSDMDDLSHLESQPFQVPVTSAPMYSTAIKFENEPFNLTRQRQYGEQYQRTVIQSTESEIGKPKKSVKVPAGKAFFF